MEPIDAFNQSLGAQEAEINRFVIRTTDLKDPVSLIASTNDVLCTCSAGAIRSGKRCKTSKKAHDVNSCIDCMIA